jgi:lipopolysaccharide biosynthesis glycosyltransferase
MAKERINILIGSDVNYAPYYGVMLTSLFMNNRESHFDVYLLTDNSWTVEETMKFERLTGKYNSNFFVFVVDASEMESFPRTTHISKPTYYRLKAPSLLPESIHKVLYLDGDIIINGDIFSLWTTDITDFAIAGVDDTIYYEDEVYARLGYDKSYGYFNAGVALYNLDYWRNNHVSDMAIRYIRDDRNKIKWMDQDVINALLFNKKKRLPLKYNLQNRLLFAREWTFFDDSFRKEILQEMINPVIVHYCGPDKPWSFRYYHSPYSELYHYYRRNSLWVNAIDHRPFIKYIKFLVKRIINHPSLDENVSEKYIKEALELYSFER